ncbi:MAG: DUF721 domain-containing protein [Alphaproteobacteria bacterium]|nr:DUF721 domain-containing protein [Alphaproteobacteria bacterium]
MHNPHMTKSRQDEQPPRRNWVSPLGPDATAVGRAAFDRAGFPDPSLVLRWAEIAGDETARLARPVKFSQGPHGGVLTLRAVPGAAIFLQHETRALCERINGYLGRPVVARLKFVQGALAARPALASRRPVPAPLPPDDPAQSYRGPERLTEALRKLAQARRTRPNMGS